MGRGAAKKACRSIKGRYIYRAARRRGVKLKQGGTFYMWGEIIGDIADRRFEIEGRRGKEWK